MFGPTQHDIALERMVDRKMRNWQLAQSQHAPGAAQKLELHDFVTISQAVGSGGDLIGERLANRLNWPFFDKQLLLAMAHDDEVRARLFASMDERDLNWFEQTFRSLESPEFRKADYFHRLKETVLCLARKAHAVFVGRAADLILPRKAGLRVRIVAPQLERLARLAQQRHLSETQAAEEVANLEHERAVWLQHHFHATPNDPTRFDLIINVGVFTPDEALELIVTALEQRGITTHARAAKQI